MDHTWYIYCITSYSAAASWNQPWRPSLGALPFDSNGSPESLQTRWNVDHPYATGRRPRPWYPPQCEEPNLEKVCNYSVGIFQYDHDELAEGILVNQLFPLEFFRMTQGLWPLHKLHMEPLFGCILPDCCIDVDVSWKASLTHMVP